MSPFTTTPTNYAAYVVGSNGSPLEVHEAPLPLPTPNEILVRVKAVAINPVEGARAAQGFMIKSFPTIIGTDGAGVVVEVGADVTHFMKDDHVCFLADEWTTGKSSNGAFQLYCCVGTQQVAKIPNNLLFEDACVLPLGLCTSAGMLFEQQTLRMTLPPVPSSGADKQVVNNDKVLIVWGGSSSVGACAIQLARLAGYNVVGIASERNFELMKQCGIPSEACFDYASPSIVEDVAKYIQGKGWELAGVAAVIASQQNVIKSCGALASKLKGNRFVSTSLPRHLMPEPKDLMPDGIECSNCYAIEEEAVNKHFWGAERWVEKALESGVFKCLPEKDIVGVGLECLQEACERIRAGVSGRKLVVRL